MSRMTEAGIRLIKHFEGLHDGDLTKPHLQPQKCPAGIYTVGYGRALLGKNGKFVRNEAEAAVHPYANITVEQAEEMLKEDMEVFEKFVETQLKITVLDYQVSALVSFAYNIGRHGFQTSTTLRELNNGNYFKAADAMRLWNKSKGKTLSGLVRRRAAERRLFLTGEFNEPTL